MSVELSFSEINAALARRPENLRRADARALTATIVVISPDERLAEATQALEAIGDRTGVRTILISVGDSKQPKARLVGNAVALPGLVPAYVNNAVAALRLSSLPTVVWWRGGACEILGLDPLHIANEGKLLAIVPPEEADAALEAMRGNEHGRDAAIIGDVMPEPDGMVVLRTDAGGSRVLDMLVGDSLPRIC